MDAGTVNKNDIMVIAEQKSGKVALEIDTLSNIQATVIMDDGSTVTVYDNEL